MAVDTTGSVYRNERQSFMSDVFGDLHGKTYALDYRDELAHLVRTRYGSRAEFCQNTGLAEERLTALLGRYVHLFSIGELNEALARIGCRLGIIPQPKIEARPKKEESLKRVVKINLTDANVVHMPEEKFQALVKLREQYVGKDNAEMLTLIQGLDQIGYCLTILSHNESIIISTAR